MAFVGVANAVHRSNLGKTEAMSQFGSVRAKALPRGLVHVTSQSAKFSNLSARQKKKRNIEISMKLQRDKMLVHSSCCAFSTIKGCHRKRKGPKRNYHFLCSAHRIDDSDSQKEDEDDKKSEKNFWLDSVDKIVENQRRKVEQGETKVKELDTEIELMQTEGAPKFLVNALEFARNLAKKALDSDRNALEEILQTRRNLEDDLKSPQDTFEDDWTAEDYAKFALTGEGAATNAAALSIGSIIQSFLTCWVASLAGIRVDPLLHDISVPTAHDLEIWLAWTIPYALAALVTAWVAPEFIGNRGTLRQIDNDEFFAKNSTNTLISVAFARGYCQALAYQGVWLLIFLRSQGIEIVSNGEFGSFLVQLSQSSTLGMLLHTPALITIPTAIFGAAALETIWWMFIDLSTKVDPTGSIFDLESISALILSPEVGTVLFGKEGLDEVKESYAQMNNGNIPTLPKVGRAREYSENEYWLTVGRVAVASAWMSTETVFTQNILFTAGTGVVGLLIAIFTRQKVIKVRDSAKSS